MVGVNRALSSVNKKFGSYETAQMRNKLRKCVFISHKYEDKRKAKVIGDFLMKKLNLDIYLDEDDADLQDAVKKNDNKRISLAINKAIEESSHILCLISDATNASWWVPYEIGYAKKNGTDIATLKLKGIFTMPSYLEIEKTLNTHQEFKDYYLKISDIDSKNVLSESYYISQLRNILD